MSALGDGPSVALRERVAACLAGMVEVQSPTRETNGDDSLSFRYDGAPCAVRVVRLAEGLEMVSMTCVLTWDARRGGVLDERITSARSAVQFGSLEVIDRGDEADVLLQYAFPGTGLEDEPLSTMLMLVLGGVSDARAALVPAVD
ncbi:MAG: hypothetical protein L0H59_10985 [Tomitella sp.]|nr:hypothetical protein [Tomitella sp.]